ncbi:MAG: Wzz/FepE/Etk N-terminal domain-containing protein [Desulfobacteria bacterium]
MEDDKSKTAPRERTMEENVPRQYEEDEIDLGQYWAILWPLKWKIAGISLAVGIVTLLLMFLKPNIYKSTAVIAPSEDEKKNTPAIGALASSFGVQLGGPSSIEDLESLFKSDDLTVRVFRKYNLWPILLADKFDPATGKVKPGWMDHLFGDEKGPKPPGDWDAIRASAGRLKVSANKKAGTISVSFESPSAEGSANIVKYYLEEGKSRLQEEALDRATQNKKFIQEQIGKTVDALTRDRFYSLYGQEVEREMMARNREQFGFRVIDSPRVPDRKSGPARGRNALGVTLVSGIAFSMYFIRIGRRKHPEEAVPGKG